MISSSHSTYSSTSTPSPTTTNINIPLPPSSTIETSNEPPRTLWMGDLDPNFDDLTIMEIWHHLGKRVIVKLIKAKKNLLIPCSSNNNNHISSSNGSDPILDSADSTNFEKININGISFIDPSVTPLHHAGYCFVEFESQNDAVYALSLNSKPIPNFKSISTNLWTNPTGKRTFRLNWASGATLNSSIPLKPEFSLFVGDLSPTVTEADLLTLFQKKFKSVKTVRVMTDPMTGASRCFGFIRFGDEIERSKAVTEMNGIWFQGRALRVAFATPRNSGVTSLSSLPFPTSQPANSTFNSFSSSSSSSSSSSTSSTSASTVMTANSLPNKNMIPKNSPLVSSYFNNNNNNNASFIPTNYSIPSPSSDVQDFQYITNDPSNTTIFVGGLNTNNINEYKLISLFQPFGNIVSVKIPLNKNCAFIKFQNRIDSEAAMQGMQGFVIDGSPIRLSWGKTNTTSIDTPHVTTTNNNNTTTIPTISGAAYNNSFIPNYTNNIQQQSDLLPSFNGSMWSDSVNNISYSNTNQLFQGLPRHSSTELSHNTNATNNYYYYHDLTPNVNQTQYYGLSSSNHQTDLLNGINSAFTKTMAPKINPLYYENKPFFLNSQFQPDLSNETNYFSNPNKANQNLHHYDTIFH